MLFFFYFLYPTISNAIQSYFVKFGEVKTLFEVMDALDAQLLQIDDDKKIITNSQFCYLSNRTLFIDGQTFKLSNNQINTDLQSEDSDFLIDVVIKENTDIFGITLNNRIFHASLNQQFTKLYDLNFTNDQNQFPQLIKYSEYLILAYSNQAYYFDFRNLQKKQQIHNWQSRNTRYYSEIMDAYLFSALGSDGLEIYFLNQDYKSYNIINSSIGLLAVDFRDFAISKIKDMNYILYILCKINGVIIIDLTMSSENVSSKLLLKNIGSKTDGIAITINFNEAVFVAYKTKTQYYVIQFKIEILSRKWGSVARFNISNKIVDIDVNEYFILVQGYHTHFLIYYQDKQNAIPFLLTSAKQFVLAGNNIYGTTSKYLFRFQPKIQPFQIKCFIENDQKEIEKKYRLMYRTNQNWKQREFKVQFNHQPFVLPSNFLLFVLLIIFILILMCVAYYQYRNQKTILTESQILEQKIKQLPQNRASKLLMPHTFRAVQTHIETRIYTNGNTDDNTILQKDKRIF